MFGVGSIIMGAREQVTPFFGGLYCCENSARYAEGLYSNANTLRVIPEAGESNKYPIVRQGDTEIGDYFMSLTYGNHADLRYPSRPISIPAGVTKIGNNFQEHMYSNCGLKSLSPDPFFPDSLYSIGTYFMFNKYQKSCYAARDPESIKIIRKYPKVTTIGSNYRRTMFQDTWFLNQPDNPETRLFSRVRYTDGTPVGNADGALTFQVDGVEANSFYGSTTYTRNQWFAMQSNNGISLVGMNTTTASITTYIKTDIEDTIIQAVSIPAAIANYTPQGSSEETKYILLYPSASTNGKFIGGNTRILGPHTLLKDIPGAFYRNTSNQLATLAGYGVHSLNTNLVNLPEREDLISYFGSTTGTVTFYRNAEFTGTKVSRPMIEEAVLSSGTDFRNGQYAYCPNIRQTVDMFSNNGVGNNFRNGQFLGNAYLGNERTVMRTTDGEPAYASEYPYPANLYDNYPNVNPPTFQAPGYSDISGTGSSFKEVEDMYDEFYLNIGNTYIDPNATVYLVWSDDIPAKSHAWNDDLPATHHEISVPHEEYGTAEITPEAQYRYITCVTVVNGVINVLAGSWYNPVYRGDEKGGIPPPPPPEDPLGEGRTPYPPFGTNLLASLILPETTSLEGMPQLEAFTLDTLEEGKEFHATVAPFTNPDPDNYGYITIFATRHSDYPLGEFSTAIPSAGGSSWGTYFPRGLDKDRILSIEVSKVTLDSIRKVTGDAKYFYLGIKFMTFPESLYILYQGPFLSPTYKYFVPGEPL
jgi:hypothetical protein